MDDLRFDRLTKRLATDGFSRRRVLQGLGGLAAALLGLAAVGEAEATACKRPNTVCGKGKTAICTNLGSDVANCGACGNACPVPADGVATCLAGTCGAACNVTGFTYCGGACVDLSSDVNNCGACGNSCAAGDLCCDGACVPSDTSNCGACGNACAGGDACNAPACLNGTCGLTPINEGGPCMTADCQTGTCQSGTCQHVGFVTPGGCA